MTRRRSAAAAFLLIFASLCTALLIGEAGVRVLRLQGREAVRVVPGRGITFVPGSAYRHVKEGGSSGRFNGQGFRDRQRRVEKAPGSFRILVLGDSFVEALQVPLDAAFPAVLEDRLRLRKDIGPIEVLAMGQSGFGTASELMRYLSFGAAYEPDVVLLAFYAGNDVRDNSRILSDDAPAFYFTLDPAGSLVLDASLMEALERRHASQGFFDRLRSESQLASLVSERLFLWRQERRAARRAGAAPASPPGGGGLPGVDPGDDLAVFAEDAGPAWRDAWTLTEALVDRLAKETQARGARLAIVSIGTAGQVEEDLGRALLSEPGRDLDRPDRRLEAMAARRGLPCLLLAPGLRQAEASGSGRLYGFGARRGGHWNAAGHREAARLIERFLDDAGLLPEAGVGAGRAFTAPSPGR